MQEGVGRKWSRWQPLMYLPQTVMNSPRENKPITSSRIGLVFLLPPLLSLLPSLIGCSCRAPRPRFSSGGLHPFHTSASRGPPPSFTLDLIDLPSLLDPPPFPPQYFFFTPFCFFSPFYLLFSSPPLPPPSLHPSHWVMAIRAGSRPAAVGDRHWSHTQSLGAEGKAIHPFCAAVFPLVALLYSCRPKQLQEARLQNEANQIKGWMRWTFNPLPVSLRWGLTVYIVGLFITETGHPKLKPHTASVTARTSVTPIQTTVLEFHRSQAPQHEKTLHVCSQLSLSCLKDVFLLRWMLLFYVSPQCSAQCCSSETEHLCFIGKSAELPPSSKWGMFQFHELSL